MKLISVLKKFIKCCQIIKGRIAIALIIILGLTFIKGCYFIRETNYSNIKLCFLDALNEIFYRNILIVIVIPVFIYVLFGLMDFLNYEISIVRNKTRKDIWIKKCLYTIMLAFLCSSILVILGSIASGVWISSFDNTWITQEGKMYSLLQNKTMWSKISWLYNSWIVSSLLVVVTTLGLAIVGCIGNIIKCLVKKDIYAYIIILGFLLIESYFEKYSFIIRQMSITDMNWVNMSSILWNIFYMLCLILIIFEIGNYISERQDYFSLERDSYMEVDNH